MKITFIGGGNMAGAIIGGLLNTGYPAASVRVVEIAAAARQRLTEQYGIAAFAALCAESLKSDCVVLAVKPQQMHAVATSLRPLLAQQLVVSIAAGIRMADLARWLGGHRRIVRAMPNTPALVGAGCAALYAAPALSTEDKSRAAAILDAVGTTLWVDREEQLDAVTALSGSGPAYVFYFMEALQQAGLDMGFSAADARRLAFETFAGAVKLAGRGEDVSALRASVTSKGGTTERALASMETDQVGRLIVKAIRAAEQRSRELGDELGTIQP